MSSRKPGYVIGVILLSLVFSAPHVLVATVVGMQTVRSRKLIPLHGLGTATYGGSHLSYGVFWKDRFVYIEFSRFQPNGEIQWSVRTTDPDTGDVADIGLTLDSSTNSRFAPQAHGDRLFFFNSMSNSTYEVVNDVLQSSSMSRCPSGASHGECFILNGNPAVIESTKTGFAVLGFNSESWRRIGEIALPERAPDAALATSRKGFFRRGLLHCCNQGDRLHCFLNLDGRFYYREGIEFVPEVKTPDSEPSRQDVPADDVVAPVLPGVSPSTATNLTGWTLVRSGHPPIEWQRLYYHSQAFMAMFIDGFPAGLIVDESSPGKPIGHFYRFDGAEWIEFATLEFPFGSGEFRTVQRSDLQRSYVVASTSTGSTHLYSVDANGVHVARGGSPAPIHALRSIYALMWYPGGAMVWALLLAIGTSGLMWWYTKPYYAFGTRNVRLAALGWRGLARLVDLIFIGTTTVVLGRFISRDFDWLIPLEAFNLRLDHPSIYAVVRIVTFLIAWIVLVTLAMIVAQATWGITPGKWLFRLRTVRTTLSPCGFARSLAREIVFFVDSGDLFFWTPGIMSIAFTDHRQRLGDLVADTIVVDANSLRGRSSVEGEEQ